MITIWKFPLPILDEPSIEMPRGARILSVGIQSGDAFVWAIVNTALRTKELRHFFIFGTGLPIESGVPEGRFLGTIQQPPFAWHVFEQGAPSGGATR